MSDAEDRAWEVVRKAYLERPVRPPVRRRGRVWLAAGVAAAVVAAVASPPGHAVFESVRRAVGVQHAEPTLLGLPTRGKILVVSGDHGGVWLVRSDGFKRLLGTYDDADWSPFGRFVVATRPGALVALGLDDRVHWTLARPAPAWPRWGGTRTDTRIAYVDRTGLRVVAGDGTGDRLLDEFAGQLPPVWDPVRKTVLAYYSGGAVVATDVDTRRQVFRTGIRALPSELLWSSDGRVLAVVSARGVLLLDRAGRLQGTVALPGHAVSASFRPRSHELAVSLRLAGRSEIRVVDTDRRRSRLLFAGPGAFGDVAWSPRYRWLLVQWPTANQWVFLHGTQVRAVGNISRQFPRPDRLGPLLRLDNRWSR